MKQILFFAASLVFLTSCALQKGQIRMQKPEDEIIPTQAIMSFLASNPNPSIVLRVPSPEQQATENDKNNNIYNAIEKELILGGFNVKDRALFNEVTKKAKEYTYEQLHQLTGVDLILELTRLENPHKYFTNTVYDRKNRKVILSTDIVKHGSLVGFKLIIVAQNEHGGNYTFYYTPCLEGNNDCRCYVGYKNRGARVYPSISFCSRKKYSYQDFEKDNFEELVRNGVKKLIFEIKK